MSDTDRTYECYHCGRSIPVGKQCDCPAARRTRLAAGKPDGAPIDHPDQREVVIEDE